MLKAERADMIYELIKKHKHLTVDAIVKMVHYSPATIRRDLTYLARLGVVKKSYGGVSYSGARPALVREHENTAGKLLICNKAGEMIKDGDMIFADGTTTSYFLVEAISKKKNVTVVTQNIKLALELGEQRIKCIVLGGILEDTSMLVGAYAVDVVRKMHFDVSFFSVGAINENGETTRTERVREFTSIIMENSRKRVLLCDATKFKNKISISYGDITVYDTIICDQEIPKKMKEKFPNIEYVVAEK